MILNSFRRRASREGSAQLVAACAIVLTTVVAMPAYAEFPEKPVRLVVGFAPGTAPDVAARIIAQKLQEQWSRGVVVENKDGAAGMLAAQEVARSSPDGYTLLLGAVAQISVAPSTYKKLPYDPQKDFAPITQLANLDFAFVAPPSVPGKTLKEYVSWGQKQNNPLFVATFGAGTIGHFGATLLADEAKLKLEPVHYKKTGDAITGILNSDVQGMLGSIALVTPYVTTGKLQAIATTGSSRSPLLPDVPTFKELGYPELNITSWLGVLAPAKTSPQILDKLNKDIVRAVQDPSIRPSLGKAGITPVGTSRHDFESYIQQETARWAKVVQVTGFKAVD